MKTSLFFVWALLLSITSISFAQQATEKTQGFNYQAVARDANGDLLNNQTISIRATIKQQTANGTSVYSETHSITTDKFGLFNLKVGNGVVESGQFSSIKWGGADQYLQIEMDISGGSNYKLVSSSPILSVPYAIHAKEAEQLVGGVDAVGTLWLDGDQDPDVALGKESDYYMNRTTGSIYKKENHNWTFVGTLVKDPNTGESRDDPNDWTINGNSGTSPGTNFLGTTDNTGLAFRINNSEQMRLNGKGLVIGQTSTPADHILTLRQKGDGKTYGMKIINSGNTRSARFFVGTNGVVFEAQGASTFMLRTANTDRLFVESTGEVGINTKTPSYQLHVVGKIKSDGIMESSDIRWKKNIKPLEGSLDKVLALKGVSYNWRTDEFTDRKFDDATHIGLIAQEVEKIVPEVVATDKQGYKSVQYGHLVSLLIAAIQEQQAIINNQNKVIGENTVKVETLQQNMNALIKALENEGVKVDLESFTAENK